MRVSLRSVGGLVSVLGVSCSVMFSAKASDLLRCHEIALFSERIPSLFPQSGGFPACLDGAKVAAKTQPCKNQYDFELWRYTSKTPSAKDPNVMEYVAPEVSATHDVVFAHLFAIQLWL